MIITTTTTPSFNPEFDTTNLPVALKWLRAQKDYRIVDQDYVAYWAVFGDGSLVNEWLGRACHSQFGDMGRHGDRTFDLIANYVDARSEEELLYLRWLATESFFSPYILNKDTAVEDKGIILPCDLPSVFLHTANLLCRFINEHRSKAPLFAKYYNLGFDGVIAYLMATMISEDNGAIFYYHTYGHGIAWYTPTKSLFDNLYASRLINIPDGATYKHGVWIYYGSNNIGQGGGINIAEWFVANDKEFAAQLAEARGEAVTESSIVSPFAKKPTANKSVMTGKEFNTVFLPYLIKKGIYIRHG